jgi:hypothetical protein
MRHAMLTVRKMKNRMVYYKETVKCWHLIFWPGSQRMVHCHTAKLGPNQRVTINQAPYKKKIWPCQESNPSHPAHLVTTQTELPKLLQKDNISPFLAQVLIN